MNKILKYISSSLMVLGVLAFTACSPDDYSGANSNGIPNVTDYSDNFTISVNQETNVATFSFTGAAGVQPVWIVNGDTYSTDFTTSKYYRKAGEYTVECKIMNANGISDGSIIKSFTVDHTIMNGFAGFKVDFEHNIMKDASFSLNRFWYAPGWSQIADPGYSIGSGEITINTPVATTDQWQAQCFFNVDGIEPIKAGTNYDGSVIFTSTADHPHVTLKICSAADENNTLFYKDGIALQADEPLCVWFSDVPANQDISDLMYIFDLGGNADNSSIVIESFVIKDHAYDDGTVLPKPAEAVFEYNNPANIWLTIDNEQAYTMSYYYAPGWAQIADPELIYQGDGNYSVTLPSATWERWQAQVTMVTNGLAVKAGVDYDFSVTIESNNAVTATAKFTQSDNDNNFLPGTDGTFNIDADGSYTFQVAKAQFASDADAVKLVFDFGGNPDNTQIKISQIIFQQHRE